MSLVHFTLVADMCYDLRFILKLFLYCYQDNSISLQRIFIIFQVIKTFIQGNNIFV